MSPNPSLQGTKTRRYASFDASLARVERATIRSVNGELHGHDAAQVHDALVARFHTSVPGAELDDRNLRKIAQAIAEDSYPV